MATLHASFMRVQNRSLTGGTMPTPDLSSAVRLTTLTTSAASQIVQLSGSDFEAPGDGFMFVICDGAVNIASGATPTASNAAGVYLAANERGDFSVRAGDKVAVIDAA